jgi:acetolactate synthase I/II/III large subunit
MTKVRGADIIVDSLIKERVPYIFGVMGHGLYGLMDVLSERRELITAIGTHHEQVAGHMADAYFRIAHRPVATYSSCGPGSANMPIALANAMMDDSAFLAITGNVATNQFSRGTFQEIHHHCQADFPTTIRPYVKRSFQATRPEMLPLMMRQAFTAMLSGRPGPVNIDVPYDVFLEQAEVELLDSAQWRAGIDARTGASPEAVRQILRELSQAERPVILVGNGATLSEASVEVRALAEALSIPVAYSPQGIGVMDAKHPLTLGSVGRDGGYPGNEATATADVILALGAEFDDRAASSWIPGYTFSIPPTKLIQVDIDEAALGRNYPVHLGLNVDVRTLVRQLLAARADEHNTAHTEWVKQVSEWKKEWEQYNDKRHRPEARPLDPEHIIRTVRQVLPRPGILAVDVGSHHTWVTSRWEAYLPQTVVQAWGYGAMGFGAAGALGAKLAAPEKPVVALCGDGGFGMVPHVVATAVEYDIPVTWIVWNNAGLGVERPDGSSRYTSRWMHHPTGKPLPTDYAAVARAYGATGISIDGPDELGDALQKAIQSNQPTVLDVRVDPKRTRVGVTGWWMPPTPPSTPEYPRASFRTR